MAIDKPMYKVYLTNLNESIHLLSIESSDNLFNTLSQAFPIFKKEFNKSIKDCFNYLKDNQDYNLICRLLLDIFKFQCKFKHIYTDVKVLYGDVSKTYDISFLQPNVFKPKLLS